MHDDKLQKILRSAEPDQAAGAIPASELLARVRAADRIHRRRRVALAAGMPVLAALALIAWRSAPRSEPLPTHAQSPQVATISDTEIRQLEAEAEAHARSARVLMLARPASSPLDDDPLADIRQQIDIVAYGMIQRADQLREAMGPEAEAIEIYRQVMRQFPNTYSAELAQQRLERFAASQQETS